MQLVQNKPRRRDFRVRVYPKTQDALFTGFMGFKRRFVVAGGAQLLRIQPKMSGILGGFETPF
jgi:hypothetical protein